MNREILEFIEENDVKFIRLAFCDLFGQQKNFSIMSGDAEEILTQGSSFDASSVKGFSGVEKSDLFLMPDLETGMILPWRPTMGRVMRFYSQIQDVDGNVFVGDMRTALQNTVAKFGEIGIIPQIGTECEFYLFKTDDSGEPTYTPIDMGTCFDIAPLDKGENIRRDICLTLEEMGMHPQNSHHECGYGQNEVNFAHADPVTSADNFLTFKSIVKTTAQRNGMFASFMPKPMPGRSGSGLHVNISLSKDGENIFKNNGAENDEIAKSFIAGIMAHISEITLFLNSNINSYARLGSHQAPKYVSWSSQNRSQLIRIPATKGGDARMELRSPDSTLNPYLAFMLLLEAGLEGIKVGTKLAPPINKNLFGLTEEEASNLEQLPSTIEEAISISKNSDFVKRVLPCEVLEKFIEEKEIEILRYSKTADEKDHIYKRYFKKL